MRYTTIAGWCLVLLSTLSVQAQELRLTLDETISMAADSSLSAVKARRSYLSGYWEYRAYKAARLPSLTLNLTPAQYNRNIVQRYDSENDRDVFRTQQSYFASGGLSVKQNIDWTGGTLYLNTSLDYLRSFGDNTYTQFSSVPFRIGYSQSLVGYNPFKWDKLIEPLKYERKKKELTYNMEQISEEAITYFFALAQAQAEYDLAVKNLSSCDTLYKIGCDRHKIAAISKADLQTLKLDVINANNTLKNSEIGLRRAMFQLASFLNLDKQRDLRIELPKRPESFTISADEALTYARENNPEFMTLKQNLLESRQTVDRTKKESGINASLNASIGFNQVGSEFKDVWHDLLQQDMVSVSLSIPILDWGVRKGKYNMARNNLNVVEISARQTEQRLEEEVIMTVNDFNVQGGMIESAEEARMLAASAYEDTRMRFIIGKSDINSLSMALTRKDTAEKNYISALRNYWLSYYKIRRLTMYDFTKNCQIRTGEEAVR
ncbi:MAG: TolC family protein [Bacteroidaceae bacterium]|nr:TolC family protein [Bacteroidaceae bacterium]